MSAVGSVGVVGAVGSVGVVGAVGSVVGVVVLLSEGEVDSSVLLSVSGLHVHCLVGISDEELYSLYVELGEFSLASPPHTLQILSLIHI